MSLTNYGETYALDAVLNGVNKWISLFIVAPDEASLGTEVVGAGYSRIAATWAAAIAGAPSTKNPLAAVDFGDALADWAAGADQVVAFGCHDAVSGGNLVWYGTLLVPRNILAGDSPAFAASALTFTMD